jgi:parallel beta-helix repeat protein
MMMLIYPVSAATLYVGVDQDFKMIQSAIDQAKPYDTIVVECGVYHEAILLSKPVFLLGEKGCTILTHDIADDIITVSADNCTISGFIIQNCSNESYAGMYVLSDGNRIEQNRFSDNEGWGLYLYHVNDNQIVNNSFSDDGINIVGSKENWVSTKVNGNMVHGNPVIWLVNRNNFTLHSQRLGQLFLVNSSTCLIENVSVSHTDQGVVLGYSENNTLVNNSVSSNRFGIRLQYSHHNALEGNYVAQNLYGMYVTHSDSNLFIRNKLIQNLLYGSYFCCNSKYNILTLNSFLNNTEVGYDYFENDWSQNNIGNFYSDYTGVDSDNDGIGETGYKIPPDFGENVDAYPIVDFWKIGRNQESETPGFGFPLMLMFIVVFVSILLIKKRK